MRGGLLLVLAAACIAACSAITGASDYAAVERCTGPACALSCKAQGGAWTASTSVCACDDGAPMCDGVCCGGTAPHCVTTSTGSQRCSTCTEAKYECGNVCCESETCLNADAGACGATYGTVRQSCASGLACPVPMSGGGSENADCCESIALPGGTFPMGRSLNETANDFCPEAAGMCYLNELPQHPVTLSSYRLDRFEVTVGRFRTFVDSWDYAGLPAGAGGNAVVAGAGWQSAWNGDLPASRAELEEGLACDPTAATWTPSVGPNEGRPINCVTWFEAFAFCAWDGGRLPTEAEWEFAAANGPAADLYPWGEAIPTPELAVYNCAQDAIPCSDPPSLPALVGSVPQGANRWGHLDLAGNVSEWTLVALGPYPAQAVDNYADVADGYRTIRGGGFEDASEALRAAYRTTNASPDEGIQAPNVGLRCARAP